MGQGGTGVHAGCAGGTAGQGGDGRGAAVRGQVQERHSGVGAATHGREWGAVVRHTPAAAAATANHARLSCGERNSPKPRPCTACLALTSALASTRRHAASHLHTQSSTSVHLLHKRTRSPTAAAVACLLFNADVQHMEKANACSWRHTHTHTQWGLWEGALVNGLCCGVWFGACG
jgi:hypothetical protein